MQEGIFVRFPVVWRELKDKKEQIKRKACVIIDNMVKLMQDPREVLPFLEVLLTALKKACDEYRTQKRVAKMRSSWQARAP